MANKVEKCLDMAAAALIAGDTGAALQQLEKAEIKIRRSPAAAGQGLEERLERLLSLAQAAAQGIADAKALISTAGTSARNVTTYDRRGESENVRATRPMLGRF